MMAVVRRGTRATSAKHNIPMDEAEIMYSFYSEHAFRNVESRNVLRECIVLDQHCHQVAAREELHD